MKKTIALLGLLGMLHGSYAQSPGKAEKVHINGKNIYYEVYGSGRPLLLLHGYSLSSSSWLPYISDFAGEFEVYVVDLPGHGKSDPFVEKLSLQAVAKDVNALMRHLQLGKINAVGFSFGGDVLFQLAVLYPDLMESMITIGATGTWTVKDFPQYLQSYTFENRHSFPWLATAHESEEHIRGIMEQFANYTVRLTNNELQRIQTEVLIMMGDDDEGMDFDEVARAKKHLPHSDIWILPNVAHGAHEGENKDEFVTKAKAFFAKRRKEIGNW